MMRIGILGGTFDPVHNGHLYLAKKACKRLSLDRLIFIPTYIPPHKKDVKVTQARHRYNMLKLAVAGDEKFKISDMEIKRKGRSYSVETLRRLRRKYGSKAELFFITGSDSLGELDRWKRVEEILKLCKFVVVERPGFKVYKIPEGFTPRQKTLSVKVRMNGAGSGFVQANSAIKDVTAVKPWSFTFYKVKAKNISATDIRNRIKIGESLTRIVPREVANYIRKNKLYV